MFKWKVLFAVCVMMALWMFLFAAGTFVLEDYGAMAVCFLLGAVNTISAVKIYKGQLQ